MAERGSSKFASIFAGRLEQPAVAPPKPNRPSRKPAPQPTATSAQRPVLPPPTAAPAPEPPPAIAIQPEKPILSSPRKVGRRAGKRSDPAYKQFSVLLRKDTHRQAVRLLYDADNGQDVSELVQQLIEHWVRART